MTLYHNEEPSLIQIRSLTRESYTSAFLNLCLWSSESSLPAWRSTRHVETHHSQQRKTADKWVGICNEHGLSPSTSDVKPPYSEHRSQT
jgi:hypothetical protein